jgi:hypothetical protein
VDADLGFLGQLGPSLVKVLPMLDERSRRLVLGMAAEAEGKGGTGRVAALTGAAWQTVANGKADLAAEEELPAGRTRRPGGGRKQLAESDPGLAGALESLVRDAMRGDPESPLTWTTRSAEHLAGELAATGHPCSDSTVWRMLRRAGYTQQSNSRAQEGRQHPERDGQFRYIAARAGEYLAAGDPVISVDSKKKEQVGNYGRDGREWGPAGEPVMVRSHDFADRDGKHAIPYGVYDEGNNAGFVNVGTDGNTAALAVESVRRWWRAVGRDAYPDAARLLVTCDSGGGNGYKNRAWKAGLAALAAGTGLDIEVCHFPPGTSKWNKIEHRLFCQISLAWRARPLTSYDVIIDTIGHVTTKTGLTAIAVLDENEYPTGAGISDEQMNDIEKRCLTRGEWHGEWNYTLLARPRPAPEPEPAPARGPDPALLASLARLAGIPDPGDLFAAAALDWQAAREHRRTLARGRVTRARDSGSTPWKLRYEAVITAAACRIRLGMTWALLSRILGVHPSTVSEAAGEAVRLLRAHGITPGPAPPRITTLSGLREYAARRNVEISLPPPQADTAPQATLTTPDTP